VPIPCGWHGWHCKLFADELLDVVLKAERRYVDFRLDQPSDLITRDREVYIVEKNLGRELLIGMSNWKLQ